MLKKLKRIKQLGLIGLVQTCKHRYTKRSFIKKNRAQAEQQELQQSWADIAASKAVSASFASFFNKLKQQPLLSGIRSSFSHNAFKKPTKQSGFVVDVLGSGLMTIDLSSKHCWQEDFKVHLAPWGKNTFYADIRVNQHKDVGLDKLYPDIKVPWELSRLQHLAHLRQDDWQLFKRQLIHWIDNNPYLLGVNWVCTMDVAIRAINIIHGVATFIENKNLTQRFWEKVVCSLYQHAEYIKHNWEWSDKPNNHYLADFLGYLYLCFFFEQLPTFKQQQPIIIKKFLAQWQYQINLDGTAYEGSTAYHRLDAEMMEHFIKICQMHAIKLPVWVEERYELMQQFLADCTDQGGTLVTIGDDDSGKIVHGVQAFKRKQHGDVVRTYADFGITLIKQQGWHITFRHPTCRATQPTGHFHQDQLAVTVSIDGIPIFVDPGSYLYTAHGAWRNKLRSYESHTTFYADKHSWRDLGEHDLFQLPGREHGSREVVTEHNGQITVEDSYNDRYGFTYYRLIAFEQKIPALVIKDIVQNSNDQTIVWQYMLHPAIQVKQQGQRAWDLLHEDTPIAQLQSDLSLVSDHALFSPAYGVQQSTTVLRGSSTGNKQVTTIKKF